MDQQKKVLQVCTQISLLHRHHDEIEICCLAPGHFECGIVLNHIKISGCSSKFQDKRLVTNSSMHTNK